MRQPRSLKAHRLLTPEVCPAKKNHTIEKFPACEAARLPRQELNKSVLALLLGHKILRFVNKSEILVTLLNVVVNVGRHYWGCTLQVLKCLLNLADCGVVNVWIACREQRLNLLKRCLVAHRSYAVFLSPFLEPIER